MKFLSVFFVASLAVTCFSQNNDTNYEDFEIELLYMLNADSSGPYFDYIQALQDVHMPVVLDVLAQRYPYVRAGIATWGDVEQMSKNQCYWEFQPLSANMTEVKSTLASMDFKKGGESPENVLMGISKGITSPTMKWTKGNMSDDGLRKVVKVLLMTTDDYNVEGAPEVDTASCTEAMSARNFGHYLRDHDITFIGLISGDKDHEEKWQSLWRQMDVSAGYCEKLNVEDPSIIVNDVVNAVEYAIEMRSTETTTTTTEPESTTTQPKSTTTTTTTEGSASHAGGLSIITKVAIGVASGLAAIGTAVAITVYLRARARRTGEEFAEGGVRSDEPVNRDQAAGTNENYV